MRCLALDETSILSFFPSTSYYHPVLSKLAVKGTPCQAKHSLRSMAKISTASSQPFDRVFAVSIVKCKIKTNSIIKFNPTIRVLAGGCQGLKTSGVWSSRTGGFSFWVNIFSFLLHGQGVRQLIQFNFNLNFHIQNCFALQ